MASAVTEAAPLTIHLAIALSYAQTRGKGLKIACAELEVLKVRASLTLSLALPPACSPPGGWAISNPYYVHAQGKLGPGWWRSSLPRSIVRWRPKLAPID